MSSIFSDHKGMKLAIKHKKKTGKITNMERLKLILPHNQWVNKEIKEESKTYLKSNQNGSIPFQNLCDEANTAVEEIHTWRNEKSLKQII